jgi:hypothetical protein
MARHAGFAPGNLAFLMTGFTEPERAALCRELRALAPVYVGLAHPLTVALVEAIADPAVPSERWPSCARSRRCADIGCCPLCGADGAGARNAMTGKGNGDRRDELWDRLIQMRGDALDRMIRRGAVEPGHLPLIAGINVALEELDSMPIEAHPAERAVVSDNGRAIRPTLYSKAGTIATVEFSPARSVVLAGRLLDAAGTKLSLFEGEA